jgi:Flp pilus assembly protein TadD
LSINPFDPIALNNLAVAEAARGRYQQALSLLQRAVKLAPARADIAANLGNMQRWLAQAEGQAALGLTPQPLQLPYQDNNTVPAVPPLWVEPGRSPVPTAGASKAPSVAPVAR